MNFLSLATTCLAVWSVTGTLNAANLLLSTQNATTLTQDSNQNQNQNNQSNQKKELPVVTIESSSFGNNQPIPRKYTCDGEDVSPALRISNIPENTKSLALIVDDPDAPMGVFDHWIVWGIPPSKKNFVEGEKLSYNEGLNHFGETRYRGPCPPKGKVHHYRFKIYALDQQLFLPAKSNKAKLEEAMEGHILGQGTLIGTYERQ